MHIRLKGELNDVATAVNVTIIEATGRGTYNTKFENGVRFSLQFSRYNDINPVTPIFFPRYHIKGPANKELVALDLYTNVYSSKVKRAFIPNLTLAEWRLLKEGIIIYNNAMDEKKKLKELKENK